MVIAEPSHRRGKAVDEKIFVAVIEVIARSGTFAIKVNDVATLAGVNKTTIYRRFPKRDDLVLAAVLSQAETVIPIPDKGSLRADLTAIAELVRETVTSPLGRALLSISAESSELSALRAPYWEKRFAAAATVIERAVKRGECAAPEDPQLLIELMVAPIHFRVSQIGADISDAFVKEQVDRLLLKLES